MNFLFKNKSKSPAEIVKLLNDSLARLDNPVSSKTKIREDIGKCISNMLGILQESGGERKSGENSSDLVVQLSQEIYTTDVFNRKEVSLIYGILLRRKVGSREPTIEYLCKKPKIIHDMISGYRNQDSAVFCGSMLRESLKHEPLLEIVLDSTQFFDFFEYAEDPNFDIASDAFGNFRDALVRFRPRVAKFLGENYEKFFQNYPTLQRSQNYVIRRQSLKIFVANPNKTDMVYQILRNNKDQLIDFLGNFQTEKDTDEQFKDEKAFLIKQLQKVQ
ncbi:hypothetical protein BB558_006752 [Smittium angustum]|nr:hypothetical protein BB558_006829 [Smittium angustum]PVZ97294.1 hypothetical protein BB558_006752 [Smittium angustum]